MFWVLSCKIPNMPMRIACSFILFMVILFAPFWVSLILAVGAMVFFRNFWEAPLLFLLNDILYGIPLTRYNKYMLVSMSLVLVLFLIINLVKNSSRFKNYEKTS